MKYQFYFEVSYVIPQQQSEEHESEQIKNETRLENKDILIIIFCGDKDKRNKNKKTSKKEANEGRRLKQTEKLVALLLENVI